MQKINRSKVSQLFSQKAGAFFSCGFTKRDRSYRFMEGIILQQEDLTTPYLTVFDTENNGVRRVNIDTLSRLEIGGKEFYVR